MVLRPDFEGQSLFSGRADSEEQLSFSGRAAFEEQLVFTGRADFEGQLNRSLGGPILRVDFHFNLKADFKRIFPF